MNPALTSPSMSTNPKPVPGNNQTLTKTDKPASTISSKTQAPFPSKLSATKPIDKHTALLSQNSAQRTTNPASLKRVTKKMGNPQTSARASPSASPVTKNPLATSSTNRANIATPSMSSNTDVPTSKANVLKHPNAPAAQSQKNLSQQTPSTATVLTKITATSRSPTSFGSNQSPVTGTPAQQALPMTTIPESHTRVLTASATKPPLIPANAVPHRNAVTTACQARTITASNLPQARPISIGPSLQAQPVKSCSVQVSPSATSTIPHAAATCTIPEAPSAVKRSTSQTTPVTTSAASHARSLLTKTSSQIHPVTISSESQARSETTKSMSQARGVKTCVASQVRPVKTGMISKIRPVTACAPAYARPTTTSKTNPARPDTICNAPKPCSAPTRIAVQAPPMMTDTTPQTRPTACGAKHGRPMKTCSASQTRSMMTRTTPKAQSATIKTAPQGHLEKKSVELQVRTARTGIVSPIRPGATCAVDQARTMKTNNVTQAPPVMKSAASQFRSTTTSAASQAQQETFFAPQTRHVTTGIPTQAPSAYTRIPVQAQLPTTGTAPQVRPMATGTPFQARPVKNGTNHVRPVTAASAIQARRITKCAIPQPLPKTASTGKSQTPSNNGSSVAQQISMKKSLEQKALLLATKKPMQICSMKTSSPPRDRRRTPSITPQIRPTSLTKSMTTKTALNSSLIPTKTAPRSATKSAQHMQTTAAKLMPRKIPIVTSLAPKTRPSNTSQLVKKPRPMLSETVQEGIPIMRNTTPQTPMSISHPKKKGNSLQNPQMTAARPMATKTGPQIIAIKKSTASRIQPTMTKIASRIGQVQTSTAPQALKMTKTVGSQTPISTRTNALMNQVPTTRPIGMTSKARHTTSKMTTAVGSFQTKTESMPSRPSKQTGTVPQQLSLSKSPVLQRHPTNRKSTELERAISATDTPKVRPMTNPAPQSRLGHMNTKFQTFPVQSSPTPRFPTKTGLAHCGGPISVSLPKGSMTPTAVDLERKVGSQQGARPSMIQTSGVKQRCTTASLFSQSVPTIKKTIEKKTFVPLPSLAVNMKPGPTISGKTATDSEAVTLKQAIANVKHASNSTALRNVMQPLSRITEQTRHTKSINSPITQKRKKQPATTHANHNSISPVHIPQANHRRLEHQTSVSGAKQTSVPEPGTVVHQLNFQSVKSAPQAANGITNSDNQSGTSKMHAQVFQQPAARAIETQIPEQTIVKIVKEEPVQTSALTSSLKKNSGVVLPAPSMAKLQTKNGQNFQEGVNARHISAGAKTLEPNHLQDMNSTLIKPEQVLQSVVPEAVSTTSSAPKNQISSSVSDGKDALGNDVQSGAPTKLKTTCVNAQLQVQNTSNIVGKASFRSHDINSSPIVDALPLSSGRKEDPLLMREEDVVFQLPYGSVRSIRLKKGDMDRHIPVWNAIQKYKVAGTAAPLGKNIAKYIEKKKGEFELYDKQDKNETQESRKTARVTIWHKEELRKISGTSAPLRKNIDRYLREHPNCEEYVDQQERLDDSKKAQANLRVTLWNKIALRRQGFGQSGPLRKNLERYLTQNPHLEEYTGQDLVVHSAVKEEDEASGPSSNENPGKESENKENGQDQNHILLHSETGKDLPELEALNGEDAPDKEDALNKEEGPESAGLDEMTKVEPRLEEADEENDCSMAEDAATVFPNNGPIDMSNIPDLDDFAFLADGGDVDRLAYHEANYGSEFVTMRLLDACGARENVTDAHKGRNPQEDKHNAYNSLSQNDTFPQVNSSLLPLDSLPQRFMADHMDIEANVGKEEPVPMELDRVDDCELLLSPDDGFDPNSFLTPD